MPQGRGTTSPISPPRPTPIREPVQMPSYGRKEATRDYSLRSPHIHARVLSTEFSELMGREPAFAQPVENAARRMSSEGGNRNNNNAWLEGSVAEISRMISNTLGRGTEAEWQAIHGFADPGWSPTGESRVDDVVIRSKRLLQDAIARGYSHLDVPDRPQGIPDPQWRYSVDYIGPRSDAPARRSISFDTLQQAEWAQQTLGNSWKVSSPESQNYELSKFAPSSNPVRWNTDGPSPDWMLNYQPGMVQSLTSGELKPRMKDVNIPVPWTSVSIPTGIQLDTRPFRQPEQSSPQIGPIERSLLEMKKSFHQKYLRSSATDLQHAIEKINLDVQAVRDKAKDPETKASDRTKLEDLATKIDKQIVTLRRELQGLSGENHFEVLAEKQSNRAMNAVINGINIATGLSVPHVFVANPLGVVVTLTKGLAARGALSGPGSIWNRKGEIFVQIVPWTGTTDLGKVLSGQLTSKGRQRRTLQSDVFGTNFGLNTSVEPRQSGSSPSVILGPYRYAVNSGLTDQLETIGYWRWREGERPRFLVRLSDDVAKSHNARLQWLDMVTEYNTGHDRRLGESDTTGLPLADVERIDAARIFGSGNVDTSDMSDNDVNWYYGRQNEGYIAIGGDWEANTLHAFNEMSFPSLPGYRIPYLQSHPLAARTMHNFKEPQWRQYGNVVEMMKLGAEQGDWSPLRRYMTARLAHNGIMPFARTANIALSAANKELDEENIAQYMSALPEPLRNAILVGIAGTLKANLSRQLEADMFTVSSTGTLFGRRIDPNDPVWLKFFEHIGSAAESQAIGSDVPGMAYSAITAPFALDNSIPSDSRKSRELQIILQSSAAGRELLNIYYAATGAEPINRSGITVSERISRSDDQGNKTVPVSRAMLDTLSNTLPVASITSDQRAALATAIDDAKDTGQIELGLLRPILSHVGWSTVALGGSSLSADQWRGIERSDIRENQNIESHLSQKAVEYADRLRAEGGVFRIKTTNVDLQSELAEVMDNYYRLWKIKAEWRTLVNLPRLGVRSTPEEFRRLNFFRNQVNRSLNIANPDSDED